MSEAIPQPVPYTLIGPPIQTTQWNEQLQVNQTGFSQKVQWKANNAIFSVFVPQGADFATSVDQLARYQGEQFDQAAKLAG